MIGHEEIIVSCFRNFSFGLVWSVGLSDSHWPTERPMVSKPIVQCLVPYRFLAHFQHTICLIQPAVSQSSLFSLSRILIHVSFCISYLSILSCIVWTHLLTSERESMKRAYPVPPKFKVDCGDSKQLVCSRFSAIVMVVCGGCWQIGSWAANH